MTLPAPANLPWAPGNPIDAARLKALEPTREAIRRNQESRDA